MVLLPGRKAGVPDTDAVPVLSGGNPGDGVAGQLDDFQAFAAGQQSAPVGVEIQVVEPVLLPVGGQVAPVLRGQVQFELPFQISRGCCR